jgi:hypothetical protein
MKQCTKEGNKNRLNGGINNKEIKEDGKNRQAYQ